MKKPKNISRVERVTVPWVRSCKGKAKLSAVTAYDYIFAKLVDQSGIEIILVGDSLGSVVQGHATTLPVTLDQMVYHCQCVTRGVKRALVVGDLPFLSYQVSVSEAIHSAGRLIKEGGVAAVKLEGGVAMSETIERLVAVDIPVIGHVGLTPQSFHRMGGHKIQGRSRGGTRERREAGSRERIIEDARAVQAAGAFALVIEGIPLDVAAEITQSLDIPTIGIGAGPHCDGQILVLHDLLGLGQDTPRFVKHFADLGPAVVGALSQYRSEVVQGVFPAESHSFRQAAQPALKSESPKRASLKLAKG